MNRILVILFTLLTGIASANIGGGRPNYEHILHYHSDIEVQNNCDVLITETIKVYAAGNQIKRGIFREIPLSYLYKGGNVHVGFELYGVKKNGQNEPYHTENMSNGIRIYAGSEDVFLSEGIYTYEIAYKVHHVLGFFKDYDEIMWNINGNGWQFPADLVTANVYVPEGAKIVQYDGYTGVYGSKNKDFRVDEIKGGLKYTGTSTFNAYENMTVAVAWEKDKVIYPTAWEEFLFWVQSYILWVIGGFGVIFGFLFNYRAWFKYGRDPKPGTIIPRFYPPDGFSPAECAYLKNEGRPTDTIFGSTLMSLAVKGMLNIEAEKTGAVFKSTKYTITKVQDDPTKAKKPLNDVETSFFHKLLGSHESLVIEKGKYNSSLNSTHSRLKSQIDDKQKNVYYKRNAHLKGRQFIAPLIVGACGALAYWMYGGSVAVIVTAVALMVAINAIFARLYEQPTKEGRAKMDEIAGFEMYMKYADKERIRLMNPPTLNFQHFEENLAYAIALGVADEWAGQFDPKELEEFRSGHMPYYHGMAIGRMSDFTNSFNSTISSAATPPSSSGSGSGGGGFSGGGGGGGGGGGW